ncbi:MAG: hypothetical protein ABH875_05480 [Candidatus Omnitrophota bacterium]
MKRWQTLLLISAFVVLNLVWGHVKSGMAKEEALSITKPERFYSIKLSKKLDEVLVNQELILQELKELKKAIKK